MFAESHSGLSGHPLSSLITMKGLLVHLRSDTVTCFRLHAAFIAAAAVAAMFPACAPAQVSAVDYPTKPVTIVVPYPAGGAADFDTRLWIQPLTDAWGKPFIIDFKPGAASILGASLVAKAPADGYNLLTISGSFTALPALYSEKDIPFDVVRDFRAVTQFIRRPVLLASNPSHSIKTLSQYVTYARSNPGKLNFGTSGVGGSYHMTGAWMSNLTDTKVTFVHYTGTQAIYQDLVAGRIDVAPITFFSALPLMKSGKIHPLALFKSQRSEQYPDIATAVEQGVAISDWSASWGLAVKTGTSVAIINKLYGVIASNARNPDIIKKAAATGAEIVASSPDVYQQLVGSEVARWKKVASDNNIRPED